MKTMLCQPNLALEKELGHFFDDDSRQFINWFEDIIQKNKWYHHGLGEKMKEVFGDQISSDELAFVANIKRFIVNHQRFLILSNLYVQAMYNMLQSLSTQHRKQFTFKKFIIFLKEIDQRIYWEPGDYPCLCCIFANKRQTSLNSFLALNTKRINESAIDNSIEHHPIRKELRKLLAKNEAQFKLILNIFSNFYSPLVESCHDVYWDLVRFLQSINIAQEPGGIFDSLFGFLDPVSKNLHMSIIRKAKNDKQIAYFSKACLAKENEEIDIMINQVDEKEASTGSNTDPASTRSNINPAKKRNKTPIVAVKSKAPYTPATPQLAGSTDEMLAMTLNLSMNVHRLKEQIVKMPEMIASQKKSTETWLRETTRKVKNIHCELHDADTCDLCHPRHQQKINHFKLKVDEKLSKITELEDQFNECCHCAHHLIHDAHVTDDKTLIAIIDSDVTSLSEFEKVKQKVDEASHALEKLVDCCGQIYDFKEETVSTCCAFHKQWESVKTSFNRQEKKPVSSSPNRVADQLEQLNQTVATLHTEVQQILLDITERTDMMELLLFRVDRLSAQKNLKDNNFHQIEDSYRLTQSSLLEQGHCELQRLHCHIHKEIQTASKELFKSIKESENKLEIIKKNYALFLGSCAAVEKMYREIIAIHAHTTLQHALPDSLELVMINKSEDQLLHAVAMIIGMAPDRIKALLVSSAEVEDKLDLLNKTDEKILMLQKCLDKRIIILNASGHIINKDNMNDPREIIFLLYHQSNYHALLIRDGDTPDVALEQLMARQEDLMEGKEKTSAKNPTDACCSFHTALKKLSIAAIDSASSDTSETIPSVEDPLNDPLDRYLSRYLSWDLLHTIGINRKEELTADLVTVYDSEDVHKEPSIHYGRLFEPSFSLQARLESNSEDKQGFSVSILKETVGMPSYP